ncbi:MAG: hypothetical protein ACLRTD_10440 [Bacteroides sp.]
MGEAVIEDGTSWYVSAGFTEWGVQQLKALKEVVMPVAEERLIWFLWKRLLLTVMLLETVIDGL